MEVFINTDDWVICYHDRLKCQGCKSLLLDNLKVFSLENYKKIIKKLRDRMPKSPQLFKVFIKFLESDNQALQQGEQ